MKGRLLPGSWTFRPASIVWGSEESMLRTASVMDWTVWSAQRIHSIRSSGYGDISSTQRSMMCAPARSCDWTADSRYARSLFRKHWAMYGIIALACCLGSGGNASVRSSTRVPPERSTYGSPRRSPSLRMRGLEPLIFRVAFRFSPMTIRP